METQLEAPYRCAGATLWALQKMTAMELISVSILILKSHSTQNTLSWVLFTIMLLLSYHVREIAKHILGAARLHIK